MTSQEATEEADLPRRSRRETVKPAKKKKKSRLKGFLVTVLVLLRFILLMIDAIGMKVISVIGVRLVNFPKLVNLGCK